MATKKKMLQAAAGNAGGAGAVEPIGVSFDGSNDYLTKSFSSGIASASKTFTFSAWVYLSSDVTASSTIFQWATLLFDINIPAGTVWTMSGYDSSYNTILGWDSTTSNKFVMDTWNHILVSIDLSDSSKRHVYVNDSLISGNYNTYSNTAVGFDVGGVATISSSSAPWKGRMAGVYLDTTYRDLSVEANRRDFIDADLKYIDPPTTGQISFPLETADTAGDNAGTGGDFTVNGTLDTAQRGPNQYNAVASNFSQSGGDYLSSSSISGASNSKAFTTSFAIKTDGDRDNQYTVYMRDNNVGDILSVTVGTNSDEFRFTARNSSGTVILSGDADGFGFVGDRYYHIQMSVDLSDTSKRHVIVNGTEASTTFSTYTDDSIAFSGVDNARIAGDGSGAATTAALGEVWFDTSYVDLSASNPFLDDDTGKPKDLGVDGSEPTGSQPLMYFPMYANNAGDNRGTGGDFTVNSGPYTGARGASEFIARGTDAINNSTSSFSGSSLGSSNTFTLVSFFKLNSDTGIQKQADFGNCDIRSWGSNNYMLVDVGTFAAHSTTGLNRPGWNIFMVSYNSSGTVKMNLNGSNGQTVTDSRYTGLTSGSIIYPFDMNTGGGVGSLFLTTEYIDISQEANRLLFVDQLGYPKDIAKAIDNGDLNQPEVFLPFSDPDDLGLNLGADGDFSINGTVNIADDVDPYA